jgi:membrane-associated phospholipid phosphatase
MLFQDLISSSVIILYIIPLILYGTTYDNIHIKGLLGLLGTTGISEFIKYNFIKDKSKRPEGAKNCNLLADDGNQEGKPGMPSSHSAQVVFFSSFYYQFTKNIYIRILLIIYAIFVMLSRYLKRCHNILQIVTGGSLGLFLSYIVRHL